MSDQNLTKIQVESEITNEPEIKKPSYNDVKIKIICEICGDKISKKSKIKHEAIHHANFEEKIKYFKGNYCKICNYGDSQKDKFDKHLGTKKHKQNVKNQSVINQDDPIYTLFKFAIKEIKEILINYKYFETINICKLIFEGNETIISTYKKVIDKKENLIKKYNTENVTLELLETEIIQSVYEKELLIDYQIQKYNTKQEINNNISKIIIDTNKTYESKTIEIKNLLNMYQQTVFELLPTINLLLELKMFNIKINKNKEHFYYIPDEEIYLCNVHLMNQCNYEIQNNKMFYHSKDLTTLQFNDITYDNIICIYKVTLGNNYKTYFYRKYKGNNIKIIDDKLFDLNNDLINMINKSSNNFKINLCASFYCKKSDPLPIIKNFMKKYNINIDILTNICEYFKCDKEKIYGAFIHHYFDSDANTNQQTFELVEINKYLNIKKKGRAILHKTIEEKEEKRKLSNINNIRKKKNLPVLEKLEKKDTNLKKILKNDTYDKINKLQVTDKTKKNYLSKLDKLFNLDVDIYNFNEEEMNKVIEIYKNNKITLKNYLISIQTLLKANEQTSKYLSDYIIKLNKEIIQYTDESKLSERQKNTFISWEEVINVQNTLRIKYEKYKTEINLMNYLYLSLYVFLPARRLEDYRELIIDNNQEICETNNIIHYYKYKDEYPKNYLFDQIKIPYDEISELNYLTIKGEDYYFIFNYYKTRKTYGKQIIKIPSVLKQIIKEYIELTKIKEKEKMFKYSEAHMNKLMQNIFKSNIQKGVSVTDLRHIFISETIGQKKIKTKYQKNIALLMSHNRVMQSEYIKVESSDEE